MANNRNKLDEYHLKILRELLTHPANKHCFDCRQRGPTYVNVTIGSFVCTTCSGMLRGLTPPHRVKSITMATFTPEEIEIMKSKGNQYCKDSWLGLYQSEVPTSDEQQIKDFMIAKYEKKRYFVDLTTHHNAINFTNGSRTPSSLSSTSSSSHNSPSSHNSSDASTKLQTVLRGNQASKTNSLSSANTGGGGGSPQQLFAANLGSPVSTMSSSSSSSAVDPFSSSGLDSSSCSETSFANFDNNPAFESTNSNNKWQGIATDTSVGLGRTTKPPTNYPSEDKYAALKDLDCQMKNQLLEKQQEAMKQKLGAYSEKGANTNDFSWTSLFSNGPGISSEPSTPFNPFSNETNAWKTTANGTVNPFNNISKDPWNGSLNWPVSKNQLQPLPTNGWNSEVANPFNHQKGLWGVQPNGQHQSSNPFL